MKSCYLCGHEEFDTLPGKVRDKPELGIRKCRACGLVCLDSFDHIQPGYYSSAYTEQNHPDQSWQHFLNESRRDDARRATQLLPLVTNRRYLDVGCGGGGVLLELREHCASAAGVEPQVFWREHLQSAGVTMHAELDELDPRSQDVISLYHVLEHVPDPMPFLRAIRDKLDHNGALVIEVPNADDALLGLYRCKPFSEFTYWSPHLFLLALQREVKKVDPNLPLYFVGTPQENQETFLAQNRIIAVMFTVFGIVAVVLAAVGLYGVMSFSVNQRTQEFGIRMALGADHARILRMVLGQGALQLLIGLGLGLGFSLAIGTLAGGAIAQSAVLFDIGPRDPLTYTAVAVLLTVVAFIATVVPAVRATRVDPMIALRAE